jgi:hypothetical protein
MEIVLHARPINALVADRTSVVVFIVAYLPTVRYLRTFKPLTANATFMFVPSADHLLPLRLLGGLRV